MKDKLQDFYRGNTVAFRVYAYINNKAIDISSDTIEFILKQKASDTDDDAVIHKTAIEKVSNRATFVLDTTDTNIDARNYYYAIRVINDANVYTLSQGTLNVLESYFE